MATKKRWCTPQNIKFKAGGRTVEFRGRPGGDKRRGGVCSPKIRTPGRKQGAIVRECARIAGGKGKAKFRNVAACVKAKWA